MKIFYKRSIWVMLTVYLILWLIVTLVAGSVLESYKKVINTTLGLTGFRMETIDPEGMKNADLEYYKSAYVKSEDGEILYETDEETGYRHSVYDDEALHLADVATADRIQREGSTLLWNSDSNGLPLSGNAKVSLFSRSSVSWGYSGGGSGAARQGVDMKQAMAAAGVQVNPDLWDFYDTGAGSAYERVGMYTMNEVPWSEYTDTVKDSFDDYGDAAIIVFTRLTREGSAGGASADVTQNAADTATGDYMDLSPQEETLINEVVALKKAGTFKKVIVLLNTPAGIFMDSLVARQNDIDCCMWVGQTGWEGLNEVARIISGASIPSGHLADTFAMDTRSTPAYANTVASAYTNANTMGLRNVSQQGVYIVYQEGIYVGYKYYETRYEDSVLGAGNARSATGAVNSSSGWVYGEEVAFPFGHGDSYTSFEYSDFNVTEVENGYEVTLTVKNTGSKKGADAVQVYVQKPYTDHDRQNGIEQAAVNLAGYAKTAELEPNGIESVRIVVRDDALKTYDANDNRTYIREKGKYYITAAQDAHAAVNNILAAKGKTPSNTGGVMDAEGDTSFVHELDFEEDDLVTFSVSEQTGNDITNRFDDADWNRYENKGAETVTYLSRSDWEKTYATETVTLTMTEGMKEDLALRHDVAADPEDEMPLYEQEHVLNLIDLKGLDYDNPAWDTLLDQLSFSEQVSLLSGAYFGTPEITRIAKPAEKASDGPLGLKNKMTGDNGSSIYAMSFPSPTLLAASFNDGLAEEMGERMGEDALHTGITGIYAPGANMHRTAYSSRNWEYHSEDGFLSAQIGKYRVIGMQSKGCYVNMKHFALNDQESYRHGVSVWANEQSIREIYLYSYELAVTEGGCTGMMSAFNRIGTKWTGCHKGICTDILRTEWGFEGFIVSDSPYQEYMDVPTSLMAGNDCFLSNSVGVTKYDAAKTNASLALAMRESTHRILYTVVNSNAMNGFNADTRIYEVREWWQNLVTGIQIAVACIAAAVMIITVMTFVFHKRIAEKAEGKRLARAERRVRAKISKQRDVGTRTSGGGFGGAVRNVFCIGQPWHAKRIATTVVSLVLAGVIVFLAIFLPIRLSRTPATVIVPPAPEPEKYYFRFEAECSEITSDIASAGTEDKGEAATNYPSGGEFISSIKNANVFKAEFDITASEATTATLGACMGLRDWEMSMSRVFRLTVNGTEIGIAEDVIFPASTADVSVMHWDWTEKDLTTIPLRKGNNEIIIEKREGLGDGKGNGLNFDYIYLTSEATLQWTKEVGVGHTLGEWSVLTQPTLESEGKIGSRCETCHELITETLPAISEQNGYTLTKDDGYGVKTWTITVHEKEFVFDTVNYPEGAQAYRFEAECSDITSNTAVTGTEGRGEAGTNYPSGGGFVYNVKNADTFKAVFNITSSEAASAMLSACMGLREWEMSMSRVFRLTVNGQEVEISDEVMYPVFTGVKYWDWKELNVTVITLKEGNNEIILEKREGLGNANGNGLNFDYISLFTAASLQWTKEVGVGHDHSDWTVVTEPTLETEGEVRSYCNTCHSTATDILPAISEENGYVKVSTTPDTSFGSATWQYVKGNTTLTFTTRQYPDNAETYVFEAERATRTGTMIYNDSTVGASNNAYLGQLEGRTWSISFDIFAESDCEALLLMRVGRRNDMDIPLSNVKMTLNGAQVSDGGTVFAKADSSVNWTNWEEYEIAVVDLIAGNNTLTIANETSAQFLNIDYIGFMSIGELSWNIGA